MTDVIVLRVNRYYLYIIIIKTIDMKNLTAKNKSLTLEENIHSALKREFMCAESVIAGEQYKVSNNRGITIMWEKNVLCEYSITTNEGRCYLMFNN